VPPNIDFFFSCRSESESQEIQKKGTMKYKLKWIVIFQGLYIRNWEFKVLTLDES